MPFFEDSNKNKISIDYSKKQPVSVIAIYNQDGKIKPVYLALTDLYGNVCKTKIDGIKYTKDGNGYTTFCCLYSNGKRQQQINLSFYIEKHLWVLENY